MSNDQIPMSNQLKISNYKLGIYLALGIGHLSLIWHWDFEI